MQNPFWLRVSEAMCYVLAQSCLILCNPMECSPPGSSVHDILPARILEWSAMPSSKGSSQPKDQTLTSSALAGRFSPLAPPRAKVPKWRLEVKLKSCLTLRDPMDCSLPGSSLHGILQARVLEWVSISFSRGSSQPRDLTRVS